MATGLPNTNLSQAYEVAVEGSIAPGNGPVNLPHTQLLANDVYLLSLLNTRTLVSDAVSAPTKPWQTIAYTLLTSARTVTLTFTPTEGDMIRIVDAAGNANTYNITVTHASSAYNFNGSSTAVISSAYGHMLLQFLNGGWILV